MKEEERGKKGRKMKRRARRGGGRGGEEEEEELEKQEERKKQPPPQLRVQHRWLTWDTDKVNGHLNRGLDADQGSRVVQVCHQRRKN